ncbi:eukaryotic porin-domain-containing protein [Mycena floridula]|nr:eukaryotic porin-domain-containing protein [Mycena floridula]
MAATFTESSGSDPYFVQPSSSAGPFSKLYNRFSGWRASLGLPSPGTVENLQKEVKSTHLTNYIFDGGRADLTKTMSGNPLFQVTHSFALGSQAVAPSYNFGAIFANEKVFLQGGIDHDANVNARMNLQGWSPASCTKFQAQISQQPGHNLLQLEHDYQGLDFSLNAKAINPSPTDLTGIYVANYLQSFTKNLAFGAEWLYQRQHVSDITTSYLAKYTSTDKSCIATAQVQGASIIQTTYWQRLSEKVEVAADLQIIAAPSRRDAIATLGAKYDLRLATFRAQLDSNWKVSALLEQRFTPAFTFMIAGEIDHLKNAAKVGVGVMIESSSLTQEEMMAQQQSMPPPA